MRIRFRWHRTITIALAAAFVFAALLLEREVTLLSRADVDHWPLGWVVVFVVAALSFACGASFRDAPERLEHVRHEDAPD
jgi:4-hydroxybenzoate polyprenyltransferase